MGVGPCGVGGLHCRKWEGEGGGGGGVLGSQIDMTIGNIKIYFMQPPFSATSCSHFILKKLCKAVDCCRERLCIWRFHLSFFRGFFFLRT